MSRVKLTAQPYRCRYSKLRLHDFRIITVDWFALGGGRYAAARSSLSAPRITILSASSGTGRCSALASSHDARIHPSRSSSVCRITGMAFGWIGSTTALGVVVRKP
jgi:hypothetical protein